MAFWEDLRIIDVIEKIEKEELVLPVIQRNLVWEEEQISLLFDTVLKGNSFGAIMTLKDLREREPLFEYRTFVKEYVKGIFPSSSKPPLLSKDISYVVDGQQRLSAFYIGLTGKYNNKELYFDLLSDWNSEEFLFEFAFEPQNLRKKVELLDGEGQRRTLWYRVKDLFSGLKNVGGDYTYISDEIVENFNTIEDGEKETIKRNIELFNQYFINSKVVGICEVMINRRKGVQWNRSRAVELFRRLNQGGTTLSALELMASKLKGFDAEHEKFLTRDIQEFKEIGLGQDEIIKYIFLLQDNHKKDLSQIDESDSEFIKKNKERILESLEGIKQFLRASKLYDFFVEYKASVIPLYFIGYYLFHQEKVATQALGKYFDNVENNCNYALIYKWIFLSLLQKVFRRRGSGWIAYQTGVRKILNVMKNYKNQDFPIKEIFEVYEKHPLYFKSSIDIERLNEYDFDFLMYILYGKKFRKEDIDHIHPYSILKKKGYKEEDINNIANYQLLESNINRHEKRDKELYQWVRQIHNREDYLKRHLIPMEEELWRSKNFKNFLKKRKELIANKLEESLRI